MMDAITINRSKKTPEVFLDPMGIIKIEGRSIPEDPTKFYEPLYVWIFEYCTNPQPLTTVDIDLEYFNSGSSKSLLYMLREFVELKNKGHKVVFNWYFEPGDDDIRERGEYYSTILETEINIIERKSNNLNQ